MLGAPPDARICALPPLPLPQKRRWDSIVNQRYFSVEALFDFFSCVLRFGRLPERLEAPATYVLLKRLRGYEVRRYDALPVALFTKVVVVEPPSPGEAAGGGRAFGEGGPGAIPTPLAPSSVSALQRPGDVYAVRAFSGAARPQDVERQAAALRAALARDGEGALGVGCAAEGPVLLSRYGDEVALQLRGFDVWGTADPGAELL